MPYAVFQDVDGEWRRVPMPVPLARVIRQALLNALAYTQGDQRAAAGYLQVSEHQMRYAMAKHGIPAAKTLVKPKARRRRVAHV